MIFEFLVPEMLQVPNFISLAQLFQKLQGLLLKLKVPLTGETGTRVGSRLSQFHQRYFNFKWRPRNFWNNWARLIKFGICNISGMRNSKIMFIFKIDNVFIYYSWGVAFLNDVITKKTKAYNFWSSVAFELRFFANFIIFHALS